MGPGEPWRGKVEETVVLNETSLPNETANCIADVVKTITFAKPTGGKAGKKTKSTSRPRRLQA